jgi:hypothetical protein
MYDKLQFVADALCQIDGRHKLKFVVLNITAKMYYAIKRICLDN